MIDKFTRWGLDFETERFGATALIRMGDGVIHRFHGADNDTSMMVGSHVCWAVRRDVLNRIKNDQYDMPKYTDSSYCPTVYYNRDNVLKNVGNEMHCIDIKNCYFETAYNTLIIGERVYDMGFREAKPYKRARNAAIGSLGKVTRRQEYKDGVPLKPISKADGLKDARLHVLFTVWEMATEIIDALGNDFYMFLTDCFYFDKKRKDVVMKILKKHGYKYRSFMGDIISLEPISGYVDKVHWYDHAKEKKKFMHFNRFMNQGDRDERKVKELVV